MYEDYFDLTLNDGRLFRWKNYGQVITVDGEDIRKKQLNVAGKIITRDRFKDIEILNDYHWFINAKALRDEEEGIITLHLPSDEINILLNYEYDTRFEEYPELDYFDWVNDYKLFKQYKERMNLTEDKLFQYLENWRRPKLKSNGIVPLVVFHNGQPVYVGMRDGESKKTAIDAFFRKIYYLQFTHGEDNVRQEGRSKN